jgi:glyoxylase-like metal-dependent hydrolase (beta-lactamase superfamily II)
VAVLDLLALGVGMRAQQNAAPVHRPVRPTYASRGEIQILPVQGTVYMLAGAGSNVTVQVGPDAVMVVDSNEAAMSDKVLTAIRTLSPAPIRYIVNTSADPDHVGGNAVLSAAGESIHPAGTRRFGLIDPQYAAILAEESVLTRMSAPTGEQALFPAAALPTSTYSAASGEHLPGRDDVEDRQLFDRRRMIQGQPIAHPCPPVVPGHGETEVS